MSVMIRSTNFGDIFRQTITTKTLKPAPGSLVVVSRGDECCCTRQQQKQTTAALRRDKRRLQWQQHRKKKSSTDVSPSATPSSTPLVGTHAPKFGTVIPSRIFVGGIAANTAETELKQYFSAFGPVKDAKIIADRAGVSKGYGFVTFENQDDADRIIKKEADNLIFKDRKLNIGPAVRKQVLPRPYDSSIPPGTVLFTNGVPYTYQNGMAIFQSPEGSYPVPQPQPAYTTVMMPQAQTVYMAPQYSPYQPTTPQQWAAQPAQWRWGPQSPGQQALASNPGYVWAAMHTSPDLMYAQPPPPQAYQTAEMDPTFVDGAPVEMLKSRFRHQSKRDYQRKSQLRNHHHHHPVDSDIP